MSMQGPSLASVDKVTRIGLEMMTIRTALDRGSRGNCWLRCYRGVRRVRSAS
jgi:hypothetical protein